MSGPAPLGLGRGHGVELEYMIVDRATLGVRPVADLLLRDAEGRPENEVERGPVAWSNELARHVIELKTNGPVASLSEVAPRFQAEISVIDALLAPLGARLMPTSMHPWMDPSREFVLWPHGDRRIYETFHRIFDCTGHGWANLQSAHLNLSFAGDEEFGRLHAAVRLLLPLLPALAASSPLVEGRATGRLDSRLEAYRTNARRVPSVTGRVVPEPLFTRARYEEELLGGIYRDLQPLDPEGVLRHEWVNARGCIARFERDAIEIRVLDVQECPEADVAVAAAVAGVVARLAREDEAGQERMRAVPTGLLTALLERTTERAEEAPVDAPELLEALGLGPRPRRARDVWEMLLALAPPPDFARPALEVILGEGCLARRILARLGEDLRPERLHATYAELCDCLHHGRLFRAAA